MTLKSLQVTNTSFRIPNKTMECLDTLKEIGNTSRNRIVVGLLKKYCRIVLSDMDISKLEHRKLIKQQLKLVESEIE